MEVYGSYGVSNGQNVSKESKNKSSLSMDDFLQIMAAEIKNQNPIGGDSGGSKADYLSQMAQFTSLEQMASMTENISLLTLMGQQQYSFSLIGKEVTIADGEEKIVGIVEKVKFQNGIAIIQVNDVDYYLGSVIEVGLGEVK